MSPSPPALGPPAYGLLAEYTSPEELVAAAAEVRKAGFTAWEAYTPFPIPDLDQQLPRRPCRLARLAAAGGVLGALAGGLLQAWISAIDTRWLVSDKPLWSGPESVPIGLVLGILGASVMVVAGLVSERPWFQYAHPLDFSIRFSRASDDRFFLLVEASDPSFEVTSLCELLAGTGPFTLELLPADSRPSAGLPRWLLYLAIAVGLGAALPFPLLAIMRQARSAEPPLHWVREMDQQASLRAEAASHYFADGRAMRPSLPGTVAWGEPGEDEHYERDGAARQWATVFPEHFPVNHALMQRGRDCFGVYCATCHGLVGDGNGFVSQRATELGEGTWVPPINLHQEYLRQQPVGLLYNTVSNGIRNMAGLGAVLLPEDRWAIVLYLRALQRSRFATLADIPAAEQEALE